MALLKLPNPKMPILSSKQATAAKNLTPEQKAMAVQNYAAHARFQREQNASPAPTPAPAPAPAPAPTARSLGYAKVDTPSAADQLTGLLSSDSRYIQVAREAGKRQAQGRGLLNSSLAAGSSEAAAIAAAAPIASQDASIIAQQEQAKLEGSINRSNSQALQQMQDASALERLKYQSGADMERLKYQNDADMERLRAQDEGAFKRLQAEIESRERQAGRELSSVERRAIMAAEMDLQQSKIAANTNLSSAYLQALSNLSANPEVSSQDRARLIAEFQRITQTGATYAGAIEKVPLNYGSPTASPATPITGGRPSAANRTRRA